MACSGHCQTSTKRTVLPWSARYLAQQMGRWLRAELNGMAQATTAMDGARRSSGRMMVSIGSVSDTSAAGPAASRVDESAVVPTDSLGVLAEGIATGFSNRTSNNPGAVAA